MRIFLEEPKLFTQQNIKIENQDFEYLTKVMRRKIGDEVFIFNALDGEFRAVITSVEKKFLQIRIEEKISELKKSENITLAFALIKNIESTAQKATEIGVACFQPIITQNTVIHKMNEKRFKANVKEAVEQCERNDFPQIKEVKKLEEILKEKENSDAILILCDESGQASKAHQILPKIFAAKKLNQEIMIFIGPEGGFTKAEFDKMRNIKNLHSISLGRNILRADTAAVVATALVQEFL